MKPDEMREKAIDLFLSRMHCSQVLAMVGQDKLGEQNPAVIKALGSFGGGIGGTGNICGVLVGAASVIGSMHSRSSLEDKENPRMRAATKELMKSFKNLTDRYGGINCGQIARVDWIDRDQVKNFYGNEESRRQHCIKVVGETAKTLGLILEKETEVMNSKKS